MQIHTQVSLDWPRCLDGYEIVPPDGDPLEPVQVYEAMLQRDPQDASALAGLARCCLKRGDVARAEQIIRPLAPKILQNPAVKRAFRDVTDARWAKLEQQVYPERTSPPALPDEWTHRLRPRTTAVTATRPLDHNAGLFRRFADLAFEPDCYRKFSDECGLLIDAYDPTLWAYASFHACVRGSLGLQVPTWVLEQFNPSSIDLTTASEAMIVALGNLVVLGSGDNLPSLTRLKILIEHGCITGVSTTSGRLEIVIRPRNLMVAIALQTIRHLSGEQERTGVQLLQCAHCHKHFHAGTGTPKRTRSKFCSPKCGDEARYAKKKLKRREGLASPDKARTAQE
jgi:Tetratricopeptide repeat